MPPYCCQKHTKLTSRTQLVAACCPVRSRIIGGSTNVGHRVSPLCMTTDKDWSSRSFQLVQDPAPQLAEPSEICLFQFHWSICSENTTLCYLYSTKLQSSSHWISQPPLPHLLFKPPYSAHTCSLAPFPFPLISFIIIFKEDQSLTLSSRNCPMASAPYSFCYFLT